MSRCWGPTPVIDNPTESEEKIVPDIETPEEHAASEWRVGLGFEEMPAAKAGKRLGVQWTPWMGDYFQSWSPRNDNCNGEGPWDQWIDLALKILGDPLTKIVRPEAWMENPAVKNFYDEAATYLSTTDLRKRFGGSKAVGTDA